jgi:small subunit ribosomal protein S9
MATIKKTKSKTEKKPTATKEKKAAKKPVKKVTKKKSEVKPKITTPKEKPKTPEIKERYIEAVGRRKTSVARIRIFPQKDGFSVNGKEIKDYFGVFELQEIVRAPFEVLRLDAKFFVSAKVKGGGKRGQAEAIRHGVARALIKFNPEFRKRLKKYGYLKRDPRMKERKKYGLKKARRAPQWRKKERKKYGLKKARRAPQWRKR